MKCCINYQNHQTINNTMKKIFTFVLIVCTIQNMFAQAVGYQGKKFTIEVGYSPVTTLTARYFDFNLSDAHYLNESPILVKHIPKIGVEYVVLNRGSLMLRYNRWNFTTNLEYPTSFKNAINAKNNAVQKALMAENKVKQAEAEAKIKVAEAQGDAESTLTRARAEAEANKLKQATLTPMLLQQQWIDAWRKGGAQVPTYMAGGGEKFMMNIK